MESSRSGYFEKPVYIGKDMSKVLKTLNVENLLKCQ